MRKVFMLLLVICLAFFTACNKKKENSENKSENTPLIGIAKITFHPSLNATEQGILDELNEAGIKARFDMQNANGDINTAASIANKFKSDKVDVAVGISTPIAVALANSISDKPVVFTAITDPVSAHLVESLDKGYKNITGAVDTIAIKEQINEFRKIYPFKKLGFIYTSSESNSVSMAATTEKVCKDLGIEFIPATITNSSEIKQAAESLVGRVDAFYVVNDNALVSGINALTSTAKVNKIPVFSGDPTSSMEGGVLLVMGFDYYKLGRATGRIIIDILNGKKPSEIPVFILTKPEDMQMIIDLDAAKNLGITMPDELIKQATFIIENGKLNNKKAK